MTRTACLISLAASVLGLIGCTFEVHGRYRDDGMYSVDPADAPECPFRAGLLYVADDPYPFCQRTPDMSFLEFCPRSGTRWGASFWHAERRESRYCNSDPDCNACFCAVSCESDADCPEPTSGTARAYCSGDADGCFLSCDNGERCPDGMYCAHTLEYDRFVCAWMSHGDRCSPTTDGGWG